MPLILVEAAGEPGAFLRRVQEEPQVAAELLAACEEALPAVMFALEQLARIHDGYPEIVGEARRALAAVRAAIERAKGGA